MTIRAYVTRQKNVKSVAKTRERRCGNGVTKLQPCPEYEYPWVWIDGLHPGDACSGVKVCHGMGRVCKFISEYLWQLKK
jgi:hypothetical protein